MRIRHKLTGVFLLFTLSITLLFYFTGLRYQKKNFEAIFHSIIKDKKESFENLRARDTNMLFSALEVIVQDPGFKRLYLEKKRDGLFAHGQSLFQSLKNKYGITHFYFIEPDGRVFLRMHNQRLHGDLVKRQSFISARDAMAPAWEVELGKTAFALRAVMPYYEGARLIGFVELGEEIDHMLKIMKGGTNSEFAILAEKKYLDRDDWKSVRQVSGLRDNWDDMQNRLILSSTSDEKTITQYFAADYMKNMENGEDVFRRIHNKGKEFMCGGIDLKNAHGQHIGAILSIIDITDHVVIAKRVNNAILFSAIIIFLVTSTAGVLIARSITSPIQRLSEAAGAMEHGDLTVRVKVTSSDEIGQLGATFNSMIESRERVEEALIESEKRVSQLNEHIVRMLMAMSHDIRGPFVSIMANLKLLIRGTFGHMDESVANTLKELSTRIGHLKGIAEDCLGKAHAVEGSLRIEREDLDLRADIIDSVLEELSSDIQERGIRIDNRLGAIPAGTIPISANKTWLKVVYRNLFKNAIKYGERGCTIAFGFEDHGPYYRLNVYNSGDPIPSEHREKLFSKFGRITAENGGSTDGIGLGLYLIRDIVQKHGGDIWYEARHDGSDFVFTIQKDEKQEAGVSG